MFTHSFHAWQLWVHQHVLNVFTFLSGSHGNFQHSLSPDAGIAGLQVDVLSSIREQLPQLPSGPIVVRHEVSPSPESLQPHGYPLELGAPVPTLCL